MTDRVFGLFIAIMVGLTLWAAAAFIAIAVFRVFAVDL
jgi:hypothetical protein